MSHLQKRIKTEYRRVLCCRSESDLALIYSEKLFDDVIITVQVNVLLGQIWANLGEMGWAVAEIVNLGEGFYLKRANKWLL